jgi:uncharacterized membrane protein
MVSKERADQISGGVFLIGLAILFMTGFWWPGIMFVIGASAMARGVAEGRAWYAVPGGLWMIGLGLVFLFNFSWPMILILIGVSMLFGDAWRRRGSEHVARSESAAQAKPKNEDKAKNDAYIIDEDEPDADAASIEDLLNKDKRA